MAQTLIRSSYTLLLIAAMVAAAVLVTTTTETLDEHFGRYASHTDHQHDNIDLSSAHSHTHKHSDDSEEHSHDHNHSLNLQPNPQFAHFSLTLNLCTVEYVPMFSFSEAVLISNPHPRGIFRPPIA